MASLQSCICRSIARTIPKSQTSLKALNAMVSSRRAISTSRPAAAMLGQSSFNSSSSSRLSRTGKTPLLRMHQPRRTMFVQTETTPNEDSLKFIPGTTLSETGQTHEFLTSQEARTSPLATALFDIPGVRLVFFGPDFISVSKSEDSQWALLKPEIYSVIIEHFTQGKSLFFDSSKMDEGPEDTRILDTDSEVVAMVKELLDTRVRPALQEDGGDLTYLGFNEADGIVRVALKGSCRGCDSSVTTLKSGIERMLTHYIPEVKSVEQESTPEEAVANDEFAKFEARLRGEGKTVTI